MSTPLLQGLVDDLVAEGTDLDERVAPLDEDGWATPTPAAGWDIRDTINHLRFFDRDALLAVTDADAFGALLAELGAAAGDYVEKLTAEGRADRPAEVLGAWRAGRVSLAGALRRLDAGVRVPWFGPPMSPASFISARLMETWAHGQDVVDALGQVRPPTPRLRSVAEIGVRARAFSYAVRGLQLPDRPVRVVLAAPGGGEWSWGPEDAADVIEGPALDFCLLVTQRRHRDDLALSVTGAAAEEWMGIAQAFAGPPGTGREPLGRGR
jgi:uncharacterized protein (TIGR03084 family)